MQNTYHSLSLRLRTARAIAHLPLICAWFRVALRRGTTLRFNGLKGEAESKLVFVFENLMKLTVRIAVVLFGYDTVKFGRRLRTSRCLHGAWTYVHHAVLVVREVCEL